MRLLFAIVVLLFHALLPAQKPITPEDIWKNDAYKSKGVPGFNFRNDGIHYTLLEANAIVQYDLRSGEKSGVVLEAASLQSNAAGWTGKIDDYAFSADEKKLLLAAGKEPIYRWSTRADYFVYNPGSKTLSPLMEGRKQRYPAFSPDASKVAFVVDNDLYIRDLATDALTRVTTDGKSTTSSTAPLTGCTKKNSNCCAPSNGAPMANTLPFFASTKASFRKLRWTCTRARIIRKK